jgi:rod shape-determining protein MreC
MAVITADGVVGKVLRVFNSTSQVLLIDDQTSGVGTILENSRLQGVLRGTSAGDIVLEKIMNDEQVAVGEKVLTSGGDQIFPKGLLVGRVGNSLRGTDSFLHIGVLPAADLSRLEEVLVITKNEEKEPSLAANTTPLRGVDILAGRLSAMPGKPTLEQVPAANAGSAAAGGGTGPGGDPARGNAPARAGGPSPAGKDAALGKPISKQPRTAGTRTPVPSPSVPRQ